MPSLLHAALLVAEEGHTVDLVIREGNDQAYCALVLFADSGGSIIYYYDLLIYKMNSRNVQPIPS